MMARIVTRTLYVQTAKAYGISLIMKLIGSTIALHVAHEWMVKNMALINADDLRTYWKVARNCDNCKYTEKNCVMDYSHSLCDFCISIDEIPTVDAIPVEWLCRKMREEENNGNIIKAEYLKELIWEFHQDDEQEAQDG
jgi:hypothetical protein